MNDLQTVWFLMAVSICPIIALILSSVALVRTKCKVGDVRYDGFQLQRRSSDGWHCLDSDLVSRREFNKFQEQLACEHQFTFSGFSGCGISSEYARFRCLKCFLIKSVKIVDLTETEKKAIELVTDFKMKDRK